MNTPKTSSSSFAPSWKYDVFLNFYGEDTRKGFTDHLHAALKRKGIMSFRDDERLIQGKYISQQLLKAIQESQYAIVVISQRYAFSKWCLMELTKIIECRTKTGITILPIFYHVDPSNVRKQRGSFELAFAKHGEDPEVNKEHIKMWKTALNDVGNLNGWHVDDSYEARIVEEISQKILVKSRNSSSNIPKELVGIGPRVRKVISLLFLGLDDIRFVGIYGMSGIGKTTLAKVLHDQVSPQFEASCFIVDIRKKTQTHDVVHLQTELLCKMLGESGLRIWDSYEGSDMIAKRVHNKRVFIIFDDVDTEEQLKALIGNHCWFGQGSRVVLTCKDLHLLKRYVDDIYEVEELNDNESLELFSWKAFKKDHPEPNYWKLCVEIMHYASGLPLALETFGSLLFGRTMDAWIAARDQLKEKPNAEILDILQISFDVLEDSQKKLFLDIAYLFIDMYKDSISKHDNKLQCLGNYSAINIEILKDKCLIKDFGGSIWMHDLLKKLGQQIIYRECPSEPGKRSRLWLYEDIIHILKYNTGTDIVEAIKLDLSAKKQERLNLEAFSKMRKLKMLIIHKHEFCDPFHVLEWCGDPSNFMLSNELRYLKWFGYPLENLPTEFQANNLVMFQMPFNHIKQLREWKNYDKVQFIDMRYSCNLTEIPDVSGIPNLVELDLQHCRSLSIVHSSLGFLKQLKKLDMEGCACLNKLPDKFNLESLKYLNLTGCSRLEKFPDIISNITSLKLLDLTGTNIKEFPLSFKCLSSLTYLNLCGYLSWMTLGQTYRLAGHQSAGRYIKFFRVNFGWEEVPDSVVGGYGPNNIGCLLLNIFSHFGSLEVLDLSYHNLLDVDIPCELICSSIEHLNLSGNMFTTIPNSVYQLPKLRTLHLNYCDSLQALSEPLFSHLTCLEDLELGYCNILDGMIPDNLGCLSSLTDLNLCGNQFKRIPDLIQLYQLKRLLLGNCTELEALPKLPFGLRMLNVLNCLSLNISQYEMDGGLSSDCALPAVRIGYDGRPYIILKLPSFLRIASFHEWEQNLEKQKLKITGGNLENIVAPAFVSRIPDYSFMQGITNSFRTIESWSQSNPSHPFLTFEDWLDSWWDSVESQSHGLALLIIYQSIDEIGNSSYGILDGNNSVLPHFLCHFQVNEVGIKESVLLSAPEVPSVGPNAFWVFINYGWLFGRSEEFRKQGFEALNNASLEASIESCNVNVEVECGVELISFESIIVLNTIINRISPHYLDSEIFNNLLRYHFTIDGLIDEGVP